MSARLHQNNQEILKNFIPLNTLPSALFTSICNECLVEECAKGTILFEQGDDAKEFIYLISGMVSLYAGEMEMETIVTGSEVARFAIAHHIPRKVKAITKSKVRIVRIPTHMLDTDRPEEGGQTYMVDEADDQGGDWMTTMLQSPVFQRLPASNLQKVMMQMEEVAFGPGEVVVKQGDEADFYYIIKSGDCELIRQSSEAARPVKLAELHSCDAFGEDALLSGNPRNVTVRMKEKGLMLRLSKANFISLVKEPVLQYVTYDEGLEKVNSGANWLDVRNADEYAVGSIADSVNIPFFSLRMKIPELRHDQLQVLVCKKGRTSEAAAFLLLKFGFNALILKGGMTSLDKRAAKPSALEKPSVEQKPKVVATKQNEVIAPKVKADNALNVEQLKEAQNRVLELEMLCAQSNEKLNKLELERNNLQQQNEQQASLVAELQVSSAQVADELVIMRDGSTDRDADIQKALSVEQEKSVVLAAELESKTVEFGKVSQEAKSSRDALSDLASDMSIKGQELESLKQALNSVKEQEEEIAEEFRLQLSTAKQEVIKFESKNAMLENIANEARREADELTQSEALLKQKIEEFSRNSSSSISEKESHIQDLNAQLSEVRSELTLHEQSKEELKQSLLEVTTELEQAGESERLAVEKHKVDLDARNESFDNELGVLQQQLDEKANDLSSQIEKIKELETELGSLGGAAQNQDSALREKEEDINAFAQKLDQAETSIASLSQQQQELEFKLAEKDELLSASTEQLSSLKAERDGLEEKLEQSDGGLSRLSTEQAELKAQLNDALQSIGELKTNESNLLADADELKQQNEQAEKGLEVSAKELVESCAKVQSLDQETETLRERLTSVEASLNAVTSGKETLESELTQRLSTVEADLSAALESNAEIAQQLDSVNEEKEVAQQKLLDLNKELESGLDGQGQLSNQLAKAQEELSDLRQHSEDEKKQLLDTLQQANSRVEELDASLNTLSEELKTGSQVSEDRLAKLDAELVFVKDSKAEIEKVLGGVESEKEVVQQELLALQRQIESGLDGQQQLTEQLSQAREKADGAVQEKDAERVKFEGLLNQAKAQLDASETLLADQAKQAEEALVLQANTLEGELNVVKAERLSSESELASACAKNEALKQKALDAETVLSATTGDQKALLEQLDSVRFESARFKEEVESKQTEINTLVSDKAVLEEYLSASKQEFEEAKASAENAEQRYADISKTLEQLSSEQEAEGGLLNGQLVELERKLKSSEEESRTLTEKVKSVEGSLSTAVDDKDKTQAELEEFKKSSLSGNDAAKALGEENNELKLSLQKVQEEKELLAINASKGSDEKIAQLTDGLLEAKEAEKLSLQRVDELMSSSDVDEREKGVLEEQLAAANKENSKMLSRVADIERKALKASGSSGDEARIKELEKQLDDASTLLLDLEIKLESSALDEEEGVEPSEEEKNELKALQSELNLVREQTEKDIHAMQAKVENSEKMNLALKKKILSMQTIANQEALPEEPLEEKKKSWW